eukprot:247819-Pleurochrysis_carterae.AAC.2
MQPTSKARSKETTEKCTSAPPPDERYFDDRGVPIVWKLLKPLYGEADAGAAHMAPHGKETAHRGTGVHTNISEFDPCYFFKKYDDEHRVDL